MVIEMRDRNANLKKAPGRFGVPSTPMGGAGSCSNAKSSIETMEQIAQQEFYEKQTQLQVKEEEVDVLKEQLEAAEAALDETKRHERHALDAWRYYAAKEHGNWVDI